MRKRNSPGSVYAKSNREIERALVQARGARLFAADFGAEHSCDQILLEAADDRILVEQVQDRRMAFENLRPALPFRRRRTAT